MSETSLAQSVAAADAPVALLQPDLAYVAVSAGWRRLHGLPPDAPLPDRYDRAFPEAAAAWADVRAAALGGTPGEARPVALDAPSGAPVWVAYRVRPSRAGDAPLLVVEAADASEAVAAHRHTDRQRSLVEAVVRHALVTLLAFDCDGVVTMRGGGGHAALGLAHDEGVGVDLHGLSREVSDGVRRVVAGEPAAWAVDVGGRGLEVSAAPTYGPDGAVDGGIGVAVDVTARVVAERRAATQAEGLRRLVSVVTQPGTLETLGAALLTEMTAFLGLRSGLLARIDRGVYECLAGAGVDGPPMRPGQSMPLSDTYCDLTMAAGDLVAIDHMARSEHVGHRCYTVVGLEAYIGTPVCVGGETVGAISFSSPEPAPRPFSDADRDLVRLAAQWAGGLLEREALRRQSEPAAR